MVFELLQGILADSLGCEEEEITMNAGLFDDLGLSASDLGDVLRALGEELGCNLTRGPWDSLTTVGELIAYVERLA